MTTEQKIKDRKIGIIGMARSGVAAAVLADSFGGKPFVSDNNSAENLSTEIARLESAKIPFEVGRHTDKLLNADYLVVSPGVPLTINIIKKAQAQGLPIFSELEFASWCCKGKIIAVTGSNGKTTTTTLLGEIFSSAGFDTFVAGNIGLPFSEIVEKIGEDSIAILEVSTFQLETISDFKPDVALLLNLSPDHLDRHGTYENYVKTKFRITENQTDDNYFVLNADDKDTQKFNVQTKASLKYFSNLKNNNASVYVENNSIVVEENPIVSTEELLILGPHNIQNATAAVCVASLFNIPSDILAKVLSSFQPVEHRLEKIDTVAGINFINDSKATNIDSVTYALRSMQTPTYLIAGGRDKGADFKELIPYGKNTIKAIIAIGEAKEKISEQLGNIFTVCFAETLQDAVKQAFTKAIPGESVLLSPGCASFDMFESFEQRGREFKNAVRGLKNGKNENETLSQN